MVDKYADEGDLFLTFLGYIDACFVEHDKVATSLDDCYDWTTVIVNDKVGSHEEVETLNSCVENSFAIASDYTSDNQILGEDRQWSLENHVTLHPSILVNNMTYTNSTG